MSKEPQLMIDYENRRVHCAYCGHWVGAWQVLIDGRHNDADDKNPSEHRVWERP